jgi:hypothetical protein
VVSGQRASHVDAEHPDGRNGADADAGGDPAETGEGDIAPLDRGPPALRRARLAESCHARTVRVDPDVHMKMGQLRPRIC